MKIHQTLLPLIALSVSAPTYAIERGDSLKSEMLEEVVVTGSNSSVSRNLIPYTVSTVTSERLEATGRTQVLTAISGMVPSLFVSQRNIFGFGISNGGAGGIKIRGVGGSPTNAVLMMVDGQPQFAGIYSHHVADFYETDYVDRVEVLRGPGSVLYGSNAMGGVINVVTKNVHDDGAHFSLQSEYGSYNTWLSTLNGTARYGKFSALVSLSYDRTDGLQKNFDFNQKSAYAKVAYDFSDHWTAKLDYTISDFEGNDPVYPKLSNPESTDIYHQDILRGEASLSVTNRYAGTDGNISLYYSYGNHFIDDPRHFHSVDDRIGVLAYQNFKPWTGAAATVGFDFNRYSGKIPESGGNHYGDDTQPAKMQTMGRKTITEYSPYVTLSQSFFGDVLILNAGVRMANSDQFDTQWIPQGGFVVHPGMDWLIKASVAKGYRNPSFREMYLYRTANPDLEPENMLNYEISVGKQFGRWFGFDVTVYYSKGRDMIQTVDMKNVNTGKFTNKGFEVSAHSHPLDCLTLNASYSYLHTSLRDLVAAPKNMYYIGAAWKVIRQLTVDAGLRGVGGLYVADDVKHQNYATLDMKITYRPTRFLDLFVNLDNITDARYVINRGYDMPGFTVTGGFKLHF